MTTRPQLAYSFQSKMIGNRLRNFAHAVCSQCKIPQEFHWSRDNNPRKIAARFQRLGWDFDPFKAGRNLCRECNPHHKEKTIINQIALPVGLKTPGERITWLRSRLQLNRRSEERRVGKECRSRW